MWIHCSKDGVKLKRNIEEASGTREIMVINEVSRVSIKRSAQSERKAIYVCSRTVKYPFKGFVNF